MQTIHATKRTGPDGTLTLCLPLGQADSEFEIVVVVQPKVATGGVPASPVANPWAGADAIRRRLASTGREFGDSVQDIREDRDR